MTKLSKWIIGIFMNTSLIPKIKNKLIRINIKGLARATGRSRTWISLVVNGRVKGEPTRRAIAEALGVSYEELWGKDK